MKAYASIAVAFYNLTIVCQLEFYSDRTRGNTDRLGPAPNGIIYRPGSKKCRGRGALKPLSAPPGSATPAWVPFTPCSNVSILTIAVPRSLTIRKSFFVHHDAEPERNRV